MDPKLIFAILSLALSLGGFVNIVVQPVRKMYLLLVVILSLIVLIAAAEISLIIQHQRRVERVSQQITRELGPDVKDFQQLLQGLHEPEYSVASEAVDELVEANQIGHKILDLRDDNGLMYPVEVYYAK